MNKPTKLIAAMKHWRITSDNLAEATGTQGVLRCLYL